MSHFYKSKTQEALDRVRQKHGLAKATTDNTKSETKSDKGKQNNSAPSAPTNEKARITNQSQIALERVRQEHGLSEKTFIVGKSNGNTKSVDASEGFKGTYTPKTTTTKPSGTTKKYTDYNTETKNAYSKTKSYAKGLTTIASDLSEEERKKRIKEIKAELSTYSTKLTGYSRAKVYGANKALLDAEKRDKERMAELSAELKALERTGTFTASELKQFEIDDAKAKVASANAKVNAYGQRPSGNEVEGWKNAVSERYNAQQELDEIKRQKTLYDDINEFGDVVNGDNFSGQWRANYRSNELSREADKAMSRYIDNPTEENREIAYAYDALAREYAENNKYALDDKNVKASWLTKSMAGYLPQFKDQIVPELVGGGVGLLLGSAVGAPNVGMSVGSGIGTFTQSYNVMRGSVYRTLLAEGVDEETALQAAKDEALISSLIESGETALSVLLAGGSKAIGAISGAAKASVAKGSTNAATKFVAGLATKAATKATNKAARAVTRPLWNKAIRAVGGIALQGGTEYLEEFTQGAVSKANREQALATVEKEVGQFGKGNINLYDRPIYKNADGTISTVDSVTFQVDDKFVVLPTIVRDEKGNAKRLDTDDEIFAHYEKTGEYLGEFDTQEEADEYAYKLHIAQQYYYSNRSVDPDDNLLVGGAKVIGDAVFGGNTDALAELHEQGWEGAKIGLMFGGSNVTVNNIITHYANAKTVKEQNEIADAIVKDEESLNALVEEAKASGEGTVSAKIAEKVEQAKANGKEVTREQVKRLLDANAVYITEEQKTAAPTTLEQAARDVVASRNATQAAENTPIFKASERDEVLPTQKETELKTESRTPVEDVTPNTALDVAQKEAEAKAIEAAFEAGRQNVPREKLNLATLEQEEAYNNGRIEHIKNMPKETPKVPNIDNNSKQAYNVSGKLTDKTKNVLDKKASQRVVGIKDGRAYISDGRIAIPVAESDVEYVKSEWGLTDNENIARVVEETAKNEYVPISTNPIEGSVPNIKSAVYVFTTDDGRQIAIQKKYAKYFDGYNLSATFVNGMPYAIKATDAEGNFAGLVMGIRPMDNKTYSLTDTKEVSMKSFKNKPTKKTTTNTNKKAEKSTPMSRLYDALEEKAPSISKALEDYQAESDKAHGNLKNAKGEYYSAELKRLATIDNAVRAIAELYSKGTITIEQAVSTLAQAYADDSFSLFYKERDGYVVPSEDLKNHFEELKKNASKSENMKDFDLTEDEEYAVKTYKSSESYKINDILRDDPSQLSDYQKEIVSHLDSALEKLPIHRGTVYRTVSFDDLFNPEEEYNAFIEQHKAGDIVDYSAFTSASKTAEGHPMADGTKYGVTLEIYSETARDVEGIGSDFEKEVVFRRDLRLDILEVGTDKNGRPYIKAKEIITNGQMESTTEEQSNVLQQVQTEEDTHGHLHEISKRNTDRGVETKNTMQRVRADSGEITEENPSSGTTKKKVTTKENTKKAKAKVVETTTKLNDFGEKIGGARKDQWNSRGLVVDDLESMNDRERDKNVKKDNVWKRHNYRALVEAGGDRGLLWATNEIRKSLQQNVYYGYNATAETKAEKQKLFVETIRAIQSMAENAKTKADFEAMGEKWLMDNGYLEDTGKTYGRYAYTQQFSQNPALSGSNYLNTIRYLAKNFDNLTALADRNQFAVDTKSVLPKGFSIVGGEDSVGSKLVNGEWVNDTSYAVAKGRYIIKDGFATREEALEWIKKSIAKKKGKTRFVPQQLLEVHRKGPDYRNSKSISGQDYIDTFGFKGGEFGNWMSAKDRQVSLDYGFDALKDLADALGIEDADISFGGNLNIAFGARGQGLSGAAAHYENERRVINLTKMNGAGSLGHEWFHALDDFIGGYTNNYATDKYYSLPEKTKQAIRDLITTMQYKDATQEETDHAAQKRYEQAVRGITYTIESEFKWVEPVENGTFKEADAKYYKRKPTKNDAKKYRELFNKLIETGEMKYVEELSALRKEVVGRVIPKEVRDSFVWRLPSLNSAKTAPIQRARKMTDFYTDSRTFGKLHSKDGDYWDSTVEMSARAFACYVADKTNKQNDYLTAHSDSAITLDADKDGNPVVVRAYPVGEERVAINKAFDNLVEALKADGFLHERTQTEKPAEVSYRDILAKKKAAEDDGIDKFTTNKSTDKLNDNEDEDKLAMWTTNRVGDKVKPKSITEIVATIEQKLGINITTGHIQGKGVLGQYDKNTRGIRTKIANNLPVISHELGHYFERTLDIQEQLTEELANELTSNLDERTLSNYPEEKLVREGVAEFTRRFLQNRETAAIDYPLFTDFFLSQLSSKDLAIFEQLADDINAYYSLDADTATSSIRLDEEGMIDLRTPMDKLKEKASSLYQAFIDSNHAIKRFDRATGSNAYMLATNAAYSDAIAGQIVTGDLTDINGQYVSAGLKTVLNGIDLNNKEEYRVFGEYLTVKHGPERLKEGKRVFADDKKNNTSFMERRQAELEAQYPQFEEISERLYGFIRKFYQTWAVDTGLLPKETLEFLNNRWEYYVPFNRVMEKGKGNNGAKRGFANQNNTLNKTKKDGSGRDIKHPVDNLINNIVRMVNAGVRNNVMLNITNSAEKLGADATFLEPVPMPLSVTKVDMTGVKDLLTNWLEESDLDATSKDKASGVVNNLDDVLLQYGRGKAHGNVVTVLKNGNPQAWKINDVELLQSLTSLSPKTMDGLLDAIAITSRFMTANITGNNIVWSIFSNLPRDIGTFFTYSKNKNVIKMARGVGSAYLNKVKGDKANPLYKEFLAMGGGKTSAYTADRNLAKDVRKKISGRKFNPNPIDWIGYVSDIVEAGPRFATYKMMREAGMTPQEAFYESMDITTNFRRSGRISKDINKVVPFFNASVQGLDKFRRWITAEEVKGADRKKAIRNRTISFMAVSAAIAAIVYAINNGDDEKEEQYEQLSSFVKNSYWVIPVGDGKYFAIPKPREIGVLSSFFERCMELGIGENDHAFDEFYDYASENFLPAIANDIVQIPTKGLLESGMGIIGSLGLIGVVGYLGANRDFLGRPIVASGLQNLEPKDQYTDRTSKMAYWLGQAFNGSPEQIDYFFQQILGGWWKYPKALFPVGEKNVDWSLGVGNTYIKDNQYSTDLTNWLYDRKNTTAKSKNSNPDDIEKAITAKWDSNMVDFYGTYYKKAKADSKSVSARSTRQLVLDIIKEYQKGIDGDYKTSWQKSVENVCKSKGSTEYMPSVMSSEITDGNDKKHSLSDTQYVEYQTDYLRLYWEIVEDTMSPKMTTTEKADILIAAKRVAREQATERTLKRIGAPSTKFATQYEGVSNDTLTEFLAGVSAAGGENSVKKSDVVNVISGLDTDDDEAWKLYFSKYDEKGSTYAYNNGIGGEDYIDFLLALEKYDTPNDNGKLGTYTQEEEERAIKSLKGLSQKEKAILYKSVNLSSKKNPFR